MGLEKLCNVQGVACFRYYFRRLLAAGSCADPMDARCHDQRDHLGAQWPGLLVRRLVGRPTRHSMEFQFGSAGSGKVSWGSVADGLCLGVGDRVAGLRAVQCVES